MDDPARLKRSVRMLLDLEFDTLLFGDGVSILRDAKLRLKELVDTFPRVWSPQRAGPSNSHSNTSAFI